MQKSIGRLISILYRKHQIYMNHILKDYDLTASEYPFLLYLYNHDGATQDALSMHLSIDKAATARSIQALLAKGFVSRKKDLRDKRCNRIYLQQKAFDCRAGISDALYQWSYIITGGMAEDTKDKLYEQMEALAANAENYCAANERSN